MFSTKALGFGLIATLVLVGCTDRQVGYEATSTAFGYDVRQNAAIQAGTEIIAPLVVDFRRAALNMVNFPFNSAVLTPEARAILDEQAAWIVRNPQVQLRIYGNTDLVGSYEYNYQLGLRRARAVEQYLRSRGVSSLRVEAVVSFGKTRPLIQTEAPELLNRRTVTEVVGVRPRGAPDFDGKRAYRVYNEYVSGETGPQIVSESMGNVALDQYAQ